MAIFGVGLNTSGSVADFVKNPFTISTGGKARADDFPDGFVMEEISLSSKPLNLVKITLIGNQMPQVPFSWGGSQKVVKDYYPGNPEAHTQVLGGREDDFSIKGRFHAKKYSSDPTSTGYQVPQALVDEIDAMRNRGNIVKLTMGSFVRYVHILNTKWGLKNLADIDYEITFTVISLNEPKLCPVIAGTNTVPTSNNLAVLQAGFEAEKNRTKIPDSVPAGITDIINECTSGIASAVTGVTDFIDGIITTGENITNSINRAVGVVKNAEANVNKFKTRLASISYNLSFAGIPVPDKYSASHIISSRIGTANDFSALLASLRKQFKALSATIPMSRHKVQDQETLQRIAVKFYGNADNWKKIYDHNKLTSTALTRGAVLEIPKI